VNPIDSYFASLQFRHDLIEQFKAAEPDYFWLIVPDGDPKTISLTGDAPTEFFMLCKPLATAHAPFGFFAAMRCDGESYNDADDKMKWVRNVAAKAVAQLKKMQVGDLISARQGNHQV